MWPILWPVQEPVFGLVVLVWAVFVGIIYATIGLEHLIGNNILDNCCLMNVDICMLIY